MANTFDNAFQARFGVVVIGRNEGERLINCLKSLSGAAAVIYVDSNSTDGSVKAARELGADVVELDSSIPFTASRARKVGFHRLLRVRPNLPYVQFVDGDCEIADGWLRAAVAFLDRQLDASAVCGKLSERFPDRSIYNWLCEKEWDRPTGEVHAFAGNVMIRAAALDAVGGYREDLIAGEEEELSVRLRHANWRIWRLPEHMAAHDASMTRFGQWWKRSSRAGYAFAQGAFLHGAAPERFKVRESCRALIWGFVIPAICALAGLFLYPMGLLFWLVYPAQLIRLIMKGHGSLRDRTKLSFFFMLARFPEFAGEVIFVRDKLRRAGTRIIEYK